MANISKQDLHGARTAADLERKYGTRFAEVMGVATGARQTAEKAAESVQKLDSDLSQDEIFKRLTNNGEAQGVFRGEDGQLYINAAYIVALAEMFAKDITMTGTLTNTVETFLEPGDAEIEYMQKHILGTSVIPSTEIPLYDFNGDGVITSRDLRIAELAKLGVESLADWPGAVKTPVTLTVNLNDPQKAIRITGTNMWGRVVDEYVGVAGTSLPHTGTQDYVVEQDTVGDSNNDFVTWRYRKWSSGVAECWTKQTVNGTFAQQWGSMFILNAKPVRLSYPVAFIDVPAETVTARAPSSACWVFTESGGNGQNTKTETAVYNVARPNEVTTEQQVEYSYYVVGRWK